MNVDEAIEIATSTAITLTKLEMAEVAEVLAAEVERLRAELAVAKAASVLPVGITDLELSESGHRIEFYLEGDKQDGEKMLVWLRQKIGNGITGGQGE